MHTNVHDHTYQSTHTHVYAMSSIHSRTLLGGSRGGGEGRGLAGARVGGERALAAGLALEGRLQRRLIDVDVLHLHHQGRLQLGGCRCGGSVSGWVERNWPT